MLILPLNKQDQAGVPFFTLLVCLICVLVYFIAPEDAALSLAYSPHSPNVAKMFSSVFVHGDIFHLFGNLFFFYCFSRTVESELTNKGYVIAFAVFVIATDLAYSVSTKNLIPTIGLSGVVWGFMGLFLVRYPKENINCLVWYLWVIKKIEVPAFIFVLAFLAFDIGAFRQEQHDNINYIAHFSGFVTGVILNIGFWGFLSKQNDPIKSRNRRFRAAPPTRDTRAGAGQGQKNGRENNR